MIKYYEHKNLLLEISNTEVSFNFTLHYKEKCLFEIRHGKLGKKYFYIKINNGKINL